MRGLPGPAALDELEQRFWLEVLSSPVADAVEEQGVEWRRHGPVLATAVLGLRHEPTFNLLLGADRAGAVAQGHLAQALDWMELLGVDFHVPLTAGAPEAAAAEELLNQRGLLRRHSRVRLARDVSRSCPPTPEAIRVRELQGCVVDFGHAIARDGGMLQMSSFMFDCLPERRGWRCYLATEGGELDRPAYASMLLERRVACLGFAATPPAGRERGLHLSLLRRCILDAARCRCRALVAETPEALAEEREDPSPASRNLFRAGFTQVGVRTVWGPEPPELPEPFEDEDLELFEEDEDDLEGFEDEEEDEEGEQDLR